MSEKHVILLGPFFICSVKILNFLRKNIYLLNMENNQLKQQRLFSFYFKSTWLMITNKSIIVGLEPPTTEIIKYIINSVENMNFFQL